MHPKYEIKGLFSSTPGEIKGTATSIKMTPVNELVIKEHGITGNEMANNKYHGGDMRVIHHYTGKNYEHLKQVFPELADKFVPGSIGENIYTDELTENDLHIGDIFELGTAKVQITVPRKPCHKINLAYDDNRILKEVLNSRHVGWFYKVLEEGTVKLGDHLHQIDRPYPQLGISDFLEQAFGKSRFSNINFLQDCYDTGLMDKGWKPKIEDVLAHHKI